MKEVCTDLHSGLCSLSGWFSNHVTKFPWYACIREHLVASCCDTFEKKKIFRVVQGQLVDKMTYKSMI